MDVAQLPEIPDTTWADVSPQMWTILAVLAAVYLVVGVMVVRKGTVPETDPAPATRAAQAAFWVASPILIVGALVVVAAVLIENLLRVVLGGSTSAE